jgi:nucleotide-binding universal stress UspA family protein
METQEHPKILFPYDFSIESDNAIHYLIGLAGIFNYTVEILNISDPGTKKYMLEHKLSHPELSQKVAEIARDFRNKHGIDASFVIKNVPIHSIRKISEKAKVSFTFLAINEPQKRGATGIMKVVTASPVPVFVVQNGVEFKPYKNILFPLDDTITSRQKAGWALRFAHKNNATIHIFSVNPASLKNQQKGRKQRSVIESVEKFFSDNNVNFVTEIANGTYDDFDNDAVNYAERVGIDLFIIMIPKKLFRPISHLDFKLIFNPGKIPVLCVNERDLFLGGGIT